MIKCWMPWLAFHFQMLCSTMQSQHYFTLYSNNRDSQRNYGWTKAVTSKILFPSCSSFHRKIKINCCQKVSLPIIFLLLDLWIRMCEIKLHKHYNIMWSSKTFLKNKDSQKNCNCYHTLLLNYMLLTYLTVLVTSLLIDVFQVFIFLYSMLSLIQWARGLDHSSLLEQNKPPR